ncbi:MAG: indolepyruvate ferredoxin oxidoreductase subunit alpha [Candidatus Lokiarchaeota archaeon]|nr:indolepyruvate ferredoxin oxidoreductase subunit alpha [Candidatus Lokiarchaeota archaeon]
MIVDVISEDKGKAFLFCNEAIVRGALEADVKVVAFYPGSPVSEILDTFYQISDKMEVKMEIATNEKVALEIVAGASMGGQRSLTALKSVGLNVASDTFFSLGYTGVNKGCVMVFADDPYCHSSQSEEDGRFFAEYGYFPLLEPTDPVEAKQMVKEAFEISEKFQTLVLMRTTTRINHQSTVVPLEPLNRTKFMPSSFRSYNRSYATVGSRARELKSELLKKRDRLQAEFENSKYNTITGDTSDIGIITSGVSYNYVLEVVRKLNINPLILKLGTTNPLPNNLVKKFIEPLKSVIIVEELTPYLENKIKALSKDVNPQLTIFGKESGHFSEANEYNIPIVLTVIREVFNISSEHDYEKILLDANKLKSILPVRIPVFCPGCPHRATFWALQRAVGNNSDKIAFMNDIGCYSMLLLNKKIYSKLHPDDLLLAMGATIGTASGVSLASEDKVISIIGDSTFFHAGLPGMINISNNYENVVIIVLDNSVTAMTGQQPNPGTGYGPSGAPKHKIQIENVLKGMGFENIVINDCFDTKSCIPEFRKALEEPGPTVIISRGPCALWNDRNKRKRGEKIQPFFIDNEICRKCHTCMRDFYCPAISMESEEGEYIEESGKTWNGYSSHISMELCDGCGVCSILCPYTDHENRSEKDVIKPFSKEREVRHDL